MRKNIFTVVLALISMSAFAQKPISEDLSKWSLGLKGGLDLYRVNPAGKLQAKFSSLNDRASFDFALFAEYSPNSNYGFGIDGGLYSFNRKINDKKYYGNSIDVTVFGSLNLSNLAAPCRTGFWEKVNLYSNFGVGMGFYGHKDPGMDDYTKRRKAMIGTAGLSLEFSLAKSLALILEGQYRYYSKADLGGVTSTNQRGNDAVVANLGLRWKIGAGKKTHVRNLTNCSYVTVDIEPDRIIITERLNAAELKNDAMDNRVRELQQENQAAKNKINQLENDVTYLKEKCATVAIQEQTNASRFEEELKTLDNVSNLVISIDNIEFANASFVLNNESKALLDEIAEILKNNKSWRKINISGHTDNTGDPEFNRVLSESRAKSVKDYLASKGISADRLTSRGYGDTKPVSSNITPEGRQKNRRVEFEIVK